MTVYETIAWLEGFKEASQKNIKLSSYNTSQKDFFDGAMYMVDQILERLKKCPSTFISFPSIPPATWPSYTISSSNNKETPV